jgi:hypothetical protein
MSSGEELPAKKLSPVLFQGGAQRLFNSIAALMGGQE